MRNIIDCIVFMAKAFGVLAFLLLLAIAMEDGARRFNDDALAPSGAQPDTKVWLSYEDTENTLPPTFYHE